jgi:hypothetical protein
MSYYYFAATLPALQFDGAPPLSEAEFRSRCGEHLGDSDMKALTALCDGGKTGNAFVLKWRDHDAQMRNAVARLRAARIPGADATKWLREHTCFDMAVENGVSAAFQESNPMRRERALDQIRWNLAGELAGYDAFSAEAIFAYAIRLGIVSHMAKTDVKKGGDRLRGMMVAEAPAAE